MRPDSREAFEVLELAWAINGATMLLKFRVRAVRNRRLRPKDRRLERRLSFGQVHRYDELSQVWDAP